MGLLVMHGARIFKSIKSILFLVVICYMSESFAEEARSRPLSFESLELSLEWIMFGEGLSDTENAASIKRLQKWVEEDRYENLYMSPRAVQAVRADGTRVDRTPVDGTRVDRIPIREETPSAKSKAPSQKGVYIIPWWTKWKKGGGNQPFDWKTCNPNIQGITPVGEVLSCWLAHHPQVAQEIVWQHVHPSSGNVIEYPYSAWNKTKKDELKLAFTHSYQWLMNDLENFNGEVLMDPLPNQLTLNDWNHPCTRLTREDSWKLYLATVAHSLAMEIGGFVPWSIVDYAPEDLETFFHSKIFFKAGHIECKTYDDEAKTQQKIFKFDGYLLRGTSLPAPPTTHFEYLVNENILQPTQYQTITKLIGWSEREMIHFGGRFITARTDEHWQYRGMVPAVYVITGTNLTGTTISRHYTAGCFGTTDFYRSVLRSVNIPVERFREHCDGNHTMPIFPTIGYALSHGDDPYGARFWKIKPIDLILVEKGKFKTWFLDHIDNCGPAKYVSRQPKEVVLQILSEKLLEIYCEDFENGLSYGEGALYNTYLKDYYSLAFLEFSVDLWNRAAIKAAQLGYCYPNSVQIKKAPILKTKKQFYFQ